MSAHVRKHVAVRQPFAIDVDKHHKQDWLMVQGLSNFRLMQVILAMWRLTQGKLPGNSDNAGVPPSLQFG